MAEGFYFQTLQEDSAHEGLAEGLKDFYEDKTRSLVQRMMTVLERLKTTGQDGLLTRMYPDKNSVKTEAGLSVTTRRVVTPKPGLVGHEPGGFEESVTAEGCLHG